MSESETMSDMIAVGPHYQHIIIGFFTPNYFDLAEQFAANLSAFGEPYHLYAVSDAGWKEATLMKPRIVQRAFDDYPLRTLILMDVDCAISHGLGYYNEGHGDVAFHIRAGKDGKTKVSSSTRLVVFRPTERALSLAVRWEDECSKPTVANDEAALMAACSRTMGLLIEQIPKATGPDEWASLHHPHVRHVSAHTEHLGHNLTKSRFKTWKRRLISRALGRPYAEWKYGGQ